MYYLSKTAGTATVISLLMLLTACGQTAGQQAPDSRMNQTGGWNATDSHLVSMQMATEFFDSDWLTGFRSTHEKAPAVIVGVVRNLSNESVNTRILIADLESQLIKSSDISYVSSPQEREEVRDDLESGGVNIPDDRRKNIMRDTGAEYIFMGSINSIADVVNARQARYYLIDLTLIELESNNKVWSGQKKVRKSVTQGSQHY